MIDPVDNDATCVIMAGLGPVSYQRREVAMVERDQHPSLAGSQAEHGRVRQRRELGVLVDREHVVPVITEGAGDPATRDVRVEEETQRSVPRLISEGEERVELGQLLRRRPVVAKLLLDFLRVVPGIGQREVDLALREVCFYEHPFA